MDKKQIFVIALTLTVGMGIGSFWVGKTSAPSAEAPPHEEHGHDDDGNKDAGGSKAVGEHAEGEEEEGHLRSEEHTSELQSLMRISYAVFCLKKKNNNRVKLTKYNTNNKTQQDHITYT